MVCNTFPRARSLYPSVNTNHPDSLLVAQIMAERVGVVNLHLKVDMTENNMTMLYKVGDGFVKEKHYGLALARVVDLPPQVLEVADRVSKTLVAQAEAKKKSSKAFAVAKRRKLLLSLKETLEQAVDSPMDDKALCSYLRKLQEEFVKRMEKIESDAASVAEEIDTDEEEGISAVEEVSQA
jgi:DNA mismatch repair protein MSH4